MSLDTYKPWAWRWLNAKHNSNWSLAKVIDKEEGFCFRLYYCTPWDNEARVFLPDERWDCVSPQETCFGGINTTNSCGFNPSSMQAGVREDVLIYNPQRVLRQSGFDQGVVRSPGMSYFSALVVENNFFGVGRKKFLAGSERLFCSRLLPKGVMSRGRSQFWRSSWWCWTSSWLMKKSFHLN